jgi:secondary thiamine-phosphate synthase enzyme
MHTLTVRTERRTQLLDITVAISDAIAHELGSLVTIFVPHTTAGVLVQAAGEGAQKVAADVEAALERLVDESWAWEHLDEGDRNPWSHVRTVLTASSLSIPLVDSALALGANQAVFLAEFDGPRDRAVHVVVSR